MEAKNNNGTQDKPPVNVDYYVYGVSFDSTAMALRIATEDSRRVLAQDTSDNAIYPLVDAVCFSHTGRGIYSFRWGMRKTSGNDPIESLPSMELTRFTLEVWGIDPHALVQISVYPSLSRGQAVLASITSFNTLTEEPEKVLETTVSRRHVDALYCASDKHLDLIAARLGIPRFIAFDAAYCPRVPEPSQESNLKSATENILSSWLNEVYTEQSAKK